MTNDEQPKPSLQTLRESARQRYEQERREKNRYSEFFDPNNREVTLLGFLSPTFRFYHPAPYGAPKPRESTHEDRKEWFHNEGQFEMDMLQVAHTYYLEQVGLIEQSSDIYEKEALSQARHGKTETADIFTEKIADPAKRRVVKVTGLLQSIRNFDEIKAEFGGKTDVFKKIERIVGETAVSGAIQPLNSWIDAQIMDKLQAVAHLLMEDIHEECLKVEENEPFTVRGVEEV